MNDEEIIQEAKNLLTDMTCDNCKYNGLFSSINYMQLRECHYWIHTDRTHDKSINPPDLPKNNTCKKWRFLA